METHMETERAEQEPPVTFTSAAAEKIRTIIKEEGNPDLRLRVFVQGGGCSGFQYGFSLAEITEEDDFEIESDGVILVIDSMSLQYLRGCTIDYIENFQGSSFTINNPNATGKCGCGSSFSV
jgi:iron-sulfur cluster insertion protein